MFKEGVQVSHHNYGVGVITSMRPLDKVTEQYANVQFGKREVICNTSCLSIKEDKPNEAQN